MRVSRRVQCSRTRAHLSTVCTQVFLGAIETMHTERAQDFAKEGGGLEFDKDDPQALDLVTSASNLRSQVFHIPRKSRWEVKDCLLYTSPSPRDRQKSRMPSSA